MKMIILYSLVGQQCVGLLFENRQHKGKGIIAVFTFYNEIVPQFVGDGLGLTKITCSVRAGIDLDKGNNVGVDGADEVDYSLQIY